MSHPSVVTVHVQDRQSILSIHTHLWRPQLKSAFLSELADNTVGYCGADLKALCTEAALYALRRKYPQIYNTTQKLVLDVSSINIQASDFYKALKSIVPTAQRSDGASGRALTETARPLFLKPLASLLSQVGFIFPPGWKSVSKACKEVQGLLEVETKLTEELKAKLEKLCLTRPLSSLTTIGEYKSKRSGGLNSALPSRRLELQVGKMNHNGVENWDGGTAVRRRVSGANSSMALLSSSRSAESANNCLFKVQNLNSVYFDLDEVAEEDSSGALTNSILVSEEQESETNSLSVGQANGSSSVNLSAHYLSLSSHPHATPPVYRPRLVICGQGGMGQSSHLAPALLHALEDLQVQTLDLPALFAVSSKTPEEACTQVSLHSVCCYVYHAISITSFVFF